MKNTIDTEAVKQLFQAISKLENEEECYAFFKDICTPNELLAFSQRFDVAIRLMRGETYQEVSKDTGASTATISRVKRLLNDDSDGIEMVYQRMDRKK